MYDTINFILNQSDANIADFLAETPSHIEIIGEHLFRDGSRSTSGTLNGYKVIVTRDKVILKDCSLCKWYLGDNLQVLGRSGTQRAIEKLSDELHLPMEKASVTRIDIAQNFLMKHQPNVYFSHLGELRFAVRLQQQTGLYYNKSGGRMAFYDKGKEQQCHRKELPELYDQKYSIRYEDRFIKDLKKKFSEPTITGGLLYDDAFYTKVINQWKADYFAIAKINDIQLNFAAMRSKKDLYRMGVLALVQMAGGEESMLQQIKENAMNGTISKYQASDLREAVKATAHDKSDFTIKNDAIEELNKKVADAARYYR